MLSHLETRLANIDAELAGRPNNGDLRRRRDAFAAQLSQIEAQLTPIVAATTVMSRARREVAAVPEQPIQPRPGRTITMAIGMLLGLLVSVALAWWRTRRHGPTSRSSTPEQGPEMPSPA
jgi:LPS O-antigen subunit length determinant protein (WzzB/FepE family)